MDKLVSIAKKDEHWIHRIRSGILFDKRLSETVHSLDMLSLPEILWLYEEQIVISKYDEAYALDEKASESRGKA